MADLTCPRCSGTGTDPSTQESCEPCGGDGILDLVDPGFLESELGTMVDANGYLVWAVMYAGLLSEAAKLTTIDSKVDTVEGKCDTAITKVDTVDAKVDAVAAKCNEIFDGMHLPSVVFPWFYDSITAGSFTHSQDANYYHNANFHNDSPWDDGNQVDYKVFLSEGTYSFKFTHVKGDVFGIFKLLLDDSEKGSVDCYAVTKTYNNISTIDDVVVTLAGVKTMSIKVDGKNASATSYKLNLSAIHITKTA